MSDRLPNRLRYAPTRDDERPEFKALLLCIFSGALSGAILGIACAVAIGLYSMWQNPNDPSAGSVGIVIIGTLPVGTLFGAIAGLFFSAWLAKR